MTSTLREAPPTSDRRVVPRRPIRLGRARVPGHHRDRRGARSLSGGGSARRGREPGQGRSSARRRAGLVPSPGIALAGVSHGARRRWHRGLASGWAEGVLHDDYGTTPSPRSRCCACGCGSRSNWPTASASARAASAGTGGRRVQPATIEVTRARVAHHVRATFSTRVRPWPPRPNGQILGARASRSRSPCAYTSLGLTRCVTTINCAAHQFGCGSNRWP
jgi:hypothetical protein